MAVIEGLTVSNMTVRFPGSDRVAVNDVTLAVPKRRVLALLGPSGCGKSTLLRGIVGLQRLSTGTVSWDGERISGLPVHRRSITLMFQDGQLFTHLDVAGNIGYGLRGLSAGERTERVADLATVLGLVELLHRRIQDLSGGEAQRVALARALAPRPRMVLLDEPLSSLDRPLRERLVPQLRSALQRTGTTALCVTHDHDEAFGIADEVAIMSEGSILQTGPADRLWFDPVSAEVASFMGFSTILTTQQWQSLWPDVKPPGTGSFGLRAQSLRIGSARRAGSGQPAHGQLAYELAPTARVLEVGFSRGERVCIIELPGVGPARAIAESTAPTPGDEVSVDVDVRQVARIGS